MKINLRKMLLVASLAGAVAVPFIAKADGVNLSVNIDGDNEAHFHFNDRRMHHHPEMLAAARALVDAKRHLWYAKGDFGGHRESAIQAINGALDEIRMADDHANRRH